MQKDESLITSKQVLELLTVAHEYCLFLEKAEKYPLGDILSFIQKVTPLLYLKGSLLPVVFVSDELANERFMTEEDWESIYFALKEKLGKKDIFLYVDNDETVNNDIITASISEYLADIYQDLKDFVYLYQKNLPAAQENAVNECRLLFQTHWGKRIVAMQNALHILLYQDNIKQFEEQQFL